ncbi:MAG: hypothetical protein P1U41_03875 [Vicingaceae bacterium]|nr:hypothetical protein [Vicingaceae bacterium]
MLNNPDEIIKSDTSKKSLLNLRKDGIITLEPKMGETIQTLESMKIDFEIFKEWTQNEKYNFLVDSRRLQKFDSELRVFAQENSPIFFKKYAVIITSGTSSFLANMFMHLTKPQIPTKLFTNKTDAINWLNEKN